MKKTVLLLILLTGCFVAQAQDYFFSNSVPTWVESRMWQKQVSAIGYSVRQLSLNYLSGGFQIRVTADIYELDGTVSRKTFSISPELAATALGGTNALASIHSVFSAAVGRVIESGDADGQDWK